MIDKVFLWAVIALLCATLYSQNVQFKNTLQQLDRAQRAYDSIKQEQFPLEVQLNRYENTLEILERNVPGLAYEFRRIMSQHTE